MDGEKVTFLFPLRVTFLFPLRVAMGSTGIGILTGEGSASLIPLAHGFTFFRALILNCFFHDGAASTKIPATVLASGLSYGFGVDGLTWFVVVEIGPVGTVSYEGSVGT